MPKTDARDRKRRKVRYGPTKTNPGLQAVMRALALKAQKAKAENAKPS